MKTTVIGTGNVGLLHAPLLLQKNHEVILLKSSGINMDMYKKIQEEKKYILNDYDENMLEVYIQTITTDFELAVSNADFILIATTTTQHEDIAKRISPFIKEGQIIGLMPSYASSTIFKKYIKNEVKYVEFETTVRNGRIVNNEYVNVSFENCRVAACFNGFSPAEIEDFSKNVFKIDKQRKSTYDIAFHNPNMIVHTMGVLFSAGRIEHSKGEFWMYKEAFTPSVLNAIHHFDKEKNRLLEALGCDPLDYFDAAKWRNEMDLSKDSLEVFRSFAEDASKGPSSLNHRYLTEDVGIGLVLFEKMGAKLNIPTPIASSIITLAGALLNINFRETK